MNIYIQKCFKIFQMFSKINTLLKHMKKSSSLSFFYNKDGIFMRYCMQKVIIQQAPLFLKGN